MEIFGTEWGYLEYSIIGVGLILSLIFIARIVNKMRYSNSSSNYLGNSGNFMNKLKNYKDECCNKIKNKFGI